MRTVLGGAAVALPLFVGCALGAPTVVKPAKDGSGLNVTAKNTVNAAAQGVFPDLGASASTPLPITVWNNHDGEALNAYVSGIDSTGAVVMLSPDGSWFHPDPGSSKAPVPITANVALPLNPSGDYTDLVLPNYISAGRLWVAEGELQFSTVQGANGKAQLVEPSFASPTDPSAGVNWGFSELTTNPNGIWADISFVDFIGLVMSMSLTLSEDQTNPVQTVGGLPQEALNAICYDLVEQSNIDNQPWGEMCMVDESGNALRVTAPNIYLQANSGGPMDTYYDDYVNDVWTKYTNQDLTINTQSIGNVACRVTGDELRCEGDNRGYARPTTADIFGCNSGPFAIATDDNDIHKAVVPRLCAAFNRSTLLLEGGDVQPGLGRDSYYTTSPTNHFSRLVHEYEVDGRGYAFSYDDVNPDGEDSAGVVAGPNPQWLEIFVGGY